MRQKQTSSSGPFSTNFVSGSNPQLLSVPSGGDWINVPGNSSYGTSNFSVMKYEAKCVDLSGTPLTSPTESTYQTYYNSSLPCTSANNRSISSLKEGYPITRISHDTAKAYCLSLGAHLLTNEEYMTIARNAEGVSENWSGGKLYRGHTDSVPYGALTASSDNNGYAGTGQTSGEQRRTMTLSNGEVIWDISGNVYEHVMRTSSDIQTTIATPSCDSGTGWQWCNYGTAVSPYVSAWTADVPQAYVGPSNPSHDATSQNTGRVYTNSGASGGTVFRRGGDWNGGTYAGLFAARLDWSGGGSDGSVGFRCSR